MSQPQILKTRQAALRLTRAQFDALSIEQVSAIAQAFYLGGKIPDKKSRERVWDNICKIRSTIYG